MADHYSLFQLRDFGRETSTVKIFNGAITGASIAGFLTAFGGIRAAIEGITLGIVSKEQWVGDDTVLSAAVPASQVAQRESKWLVRYHNVVTNKPHHLEIPTADLIGVALIPGSDFADLTAAPMSTFVTAFNAFARSEENDADAVVIDSVQFVGRNI